METATKRQMCVARPRDKQFFSAYFRGDAERIGNNGIQMSFHQWERP
jgi:hypothetical protein